LFYFRENYKKDETYFSAEVWTFKFRTPCVHARAPPPLPHTQDESDKKFCTFFSKTVRISGRHPLSKL